MRPVRPGDLGAEVALLQRGLSLLGYASGPEDGVFGPRTEAAVQRFRAAEGLEDAPMVGDRDWLVLVGRAGLVAPPELREAQRVWLGRWIPATTPAPRVSVLAAGLVTLGWAEDPPGSNRGPEVDRITAGYYAPEDEELYGRPAWCALAVSYWLREGLGARVYRAIPLGRRMGAVREIEAWGAARGRLRAGSGDGVEAGAICTFDRPGSGPVGHCGLVLADRGSELLTIEGNQGHAVRALLRPRDRLRASIAWW